MAANPTAAPRHIGEAVSLLEKDFVTLVSRTKTPPGRRELVPWRAIPLVLLTLGGLALAGAAMQL